MDKNTIYAIVILFIALVALSILESINDDKELTGECKSPKDCKGAHDECEGEWSCDGECSWVCTTKETPIKDTPPKGQGCNSDSDCIITGCSSQICSNEPVISTCEWREEYACVKLSECGCNEGQCKWTENDVYLSCIQDAKNPVADYLE